MELRRQRDSESTRVPMYLPEPSWFLDRVKTYSTSDLLRRLGRGSAAQIQHANVVGLAVLGAGIIYSGNLTPFDLESDLLWRYWGRPEACYTVEVQRFFSLAEPVAIYARKSDCQGISSTKVNLQDWIFLPATDVDLECFNLVDDEALHAVGGLQPNSCFVGARGCIVIDKGWQMEVVVVSLFQGLASLWRAWIVECASQNPRAHELAISGGNVTLVELQASISSAAPLATH